MGPELEGERPAAAADFDKLAQDAYNKQTREKEWKRRFDDLSASTRLKYYYHAQKDYTKQTGKPAYSQVKGDTTFKDYFEKQDEAFQRSWLGPKRFALYQQGKYDPLHLANPDTGYVATLDELKKVVEPEPESTPSPKPDGSGGSSAPSSQPRQGVYVKLDWTNIDSSIIAAEKTLAANMDNPETDEVQTALEKCYSLLPTLLETYDIGDDLTRLNVDQRLVRIEKLREKERDRGAKLHPEQRTVPSQKKTSTLPFGEDLDRAIEEIKHGRRAREIENEIGSLEYRKKQIESIPYKHKTQEQWVELSEINSQIKVKKNESIENQYDILLGKIYTESRNIKGVGRVKILNGLDGQSVRAGLMFFARILDAKGEEMDWDSVIVCPTKSGRSYCHRNYLFICPKDKSSISAHEAAHVFTYQNKNAFAREKILFNHFTKTQNGA